MIPERYFPFDRARPEFALTVGARPLAPGEHRIEFDADWFTETQQKRACLAADPAYYFQALPGSEAAQEEAVELLLADTAGRRPVEPRLDAPRLNAFGRVVQEDLLVLDGDLRLVAGQLCFANAWCLDSKLGQPIEAVHAPVPGYAEVLANPVRRLLDRLKPERPVGRLNWGVKPVDRLDLTSRHDAWVDAQKPGCPLEKCWLRVERQTLSKLPLTGHILFTIHTYQEAVERLPAGDREVLRRVIASTPVETMRYKGLGFLLPA